MRLPVTQLRRSDTPHATGLLPSQLLATGLCVLPCHCMLLPTMRLSFPVCQVAATRDLRAMVNWPGLLELLEEEGVESVPTDGVRYWLARMGGDFQVGQLLDGWMGVAV